MKQAITLKALTFTAIAIAFGAGFSSEAAALLYNISHTCDSGCLEKTGVVWNITLHKGIGSPITISEVKVVGQDEKIYGHVNSTVIVSSPTSFLIDGTLPEFQGSTSINVSPCFTTQLEPKDRMVEDFFFGLEKTYCEKANYSTPVYQCIGQEQCGAGQSCQGNVCADLKCGQCQGILNHACTSYQCCEHSQCPEEDECKQNKCALLECAEEFEPKNHSCTRIMCADNELISNKKCIPLVCTQAEEPENHTCVKLNCGDYEAASNHTCKPKEFVVELIAEAILPKAESKPIIPAGMQKLLETAILAAILAIVILFANSIMTQKAIVNRFKK